MNLIKTGVDITKTIKNVTRFREIVSVLAKNGFDGLVSKTGLQGKIPKFVLPKSNSNLESELNSSNNSWSKIVGHRLRISFEELGSSFVKLGQLLSTREDFFDEDFISEMRLLQDQVEGIPFEEAISIIERSLEKPYTDVFSKINPKPIGQASIGVVYEGVLKSGEEIIIKVQRPGVAKKIKTDFSLLGFIIERLESVSDDLKFLGLSRMVKDFSSSIQSELDYRIEALNGKKFKDIIAKHDKEGVIYIPTVYQDYCFKEILVMEKLKGIPFSKVEEIYPHREKIDKKLEKGLEYFIFNILVDGFFHADLHGGNFFLLENDQIGIIDFGAVGTLGKQSRGHLAAILYFLVSNNYESLVFEFLEVADYENIPDVDILTKDIKECLSPYVGLTASQININQLFQSITKTLAKHQIFLPREWFLVFRSMITLDGVGKSLDMDIDLFGIVDKNINTIVSDLTSKDQLLEDAFWIGRDIFNSIRSVPRHLRWFLREVSKNNYSLDLKLNGFEKNIDKVSNSISQLGYFILTATSMACAIFINQDEWNKNSDPLFWILVIFGFITFTRGIWVNRNKN